MKIKGFSNSHFLIHWSIAVVECHRRLIHHTLNLIEIDIGFFVSISGRYCLQTLCDSQPCQNGGICRVSSIKNQHRASLMGIRRIIQVGGPPPSRSPGSRVLCDCPPGTV